MQVDKFPQVRVTDYDNADFGRMAGAIDPTDINWHSWGANGALTQAARTPHAEVRRRLPADRHRLPVVRRTAPAISASIAASPRSNPTDQRHGHVGQRASRSFLLGYPSGDPGNSEHASACRTPLKLFAHYYGGLRAGRLPRRARRLTLNYGLRLEHEDGLDGARTTASPWRSIARLNPGGALGNVVNPSPASAIRGGLVYAGVERRQRATRAIRRRSSFRRASASCTRSIRRRSFAPAMASTGRRGTTRRRTPPTTARLAPARQR